MATSNNPRKFSEKIALHNQKQAEETAAFEEVMKDLSITRAARLQLQKTQYLQLGQNRGQCYGGSLPNVNQFGSSTVDVPFQIPFIFQNSGLDTSRTTRHHGLVDRVYRNRNTSPHRKPVSVDKHGRHIDSCPYGSVYLSPPPDTSWRRTNSDSALHQSTMTPAQQAAFTGGSQELQPKRVPGSEAVNQDMDEEKQIENWDSENNDSRSEPCEVPGINIFPSPDQESTASVVPAAHDTGGSLPDLTNIQFPPPLPIPLDTDEATAASLTTSNSTGNLASSQVTMAMQSEQDNMMPLMLNTGDSQQHQPLQLSPMLSPPLTLSQAAINAMAVEQQLSQYAFFNQQSSTQTHQVQPNQRSSPTSGNQISSQNNIPMDIDTAWSLQQYRCMVGSSANQSPTSPVSNQGYSPGGSPQHNSILGSMFADFCDQQFTSRQVSGLSRQLEQFNIIENPSSSNSFYSQASTLNYSQAAMMGLTGNYCNLQDPQQLSYSSHGNIPNIILTVSGESPPSLQKDFTGSQSTDVSFDVDSQFPLDELKIDPLTLDGLHMLNDPDMVLADPATEDAFRLDRL